MNSATVSAKSTEKSTSVEESETESNVIIKLRRLRIEENLLTKNIYKISDVLSEEVRDINYAYKQLCKKLKDSYIEIRDLFEEIQANTACQDNVNAIDIDEVKTNVLNIENKIRNFKSTLQSQLIALTSEEQDLKKIIDQCTNSVMKLKRTNKVQNKKFSEMVPSPVKSIINSPLKSPEVQNFQNFIAQSKNKNGGWSPYNHEIFEKEWHKHFYIDKNIEEFEYQELSIENSERFQMFLQSISRKLPGIKIDDILAHNKWYTKYSFLKEQQKKAIEKWRLKKRLFRTSRNKRESKDSSVKTDMLKKPAVISHIDTNSQDDNKEFQDLMEQTLYATTILYEPKTLPESIPLEVGVSSSLDNASHLTLKRFSAYMNSTNQWNNRCNDKDKEYKQNVNDVETIWKRRIPEWRLVLQSK
ncbi:hypothetical protein O0L34_g7731 [Tuta absoluta]|nr:hypothetical protein O0L34_g7731 [Tuta absoluta]